MGASGKLLTGGGSAGTFAGTVARELVDPLAHEFPELVRFMRRLGAACRGVVGASVSVAEEFFLLVDEVGWQTAGRCCSLRRLPLGQFRIEVHIEPAEPSHQHPHDINTQVWGMFSINKGLIPFIVLGVPHRFPTFRDLVHCQIPMDDNLNCGLAFQDVLEGVVGPQAVGTLLVKT